MTRNDETVCQEALALLRQETKLAEGFSEGRGTPTKAEAACLRTFGYARRAFLAMHDWNFARATADVASAPAGETVEFAKPEDAIRVVDVIDAYGETVRWRLDGTLIVADTLAAKVVYTSDDEPADGWPPLARAAFVAYFARELCIPVAGRQEDLKALDALFGERLAAARLADLREGHPADARGAEIIALLRTSAGLSGAAEADGVEAATRRLGTFLRSAVAEVTASHDWASGSGEYEDLPPLAQSAALVLAAHKIAGACGAGAEGVRLLWQLYQEKLLAARVSDLHGRLAANADPVLAELVGNFRKDDAGLVHLFDVYTSRADAAKTSAEAEVAGAHDWPDLDAEAGRLGAAAETAAVDGDDAEASRLAAEEQRVLSEASRLEALKNAAVAARELEMLSVAAGGGEASAQRYAKEYAVKLRTARAYALEHEPLLEGVGGDAMLILREMFDDADGALPFSLRDRVAPLVETARREVITAHRWNFARVSVGVESGGVESGGVGELAAEERGGEWIVARPAGCVRVEAVKGYDGNLCTWSMRGGEIVSRQQPASVTYVRDVADADEWPPPVRRALALRIALDAAVAGTSRDHADRLSRAYEKALSDAAVQDAREGNPGRDAWGRGRFAAAMSGKGSRRW